MQSHNKKIVSFSLWGVYDIYNRGLLSNLEEVADIYPGWTPRVYIHAKSPILELVRKTGAEVFVKDSDEHYKNSLWRFEAASDPAADAIIFRDADSRLSVKEAGAVREWLASGKKMHVMTDIPHAPAAIMAGLWGIRGGVIPNIRELIDSWIAKTNPLNLYGIDEIFIEQAIWPLLKNDIYHHGMESLIGPGIPFPPYPPMGHGMSHLGQKCVWEYPLKLTIVEPDPDDALFSCMWLLERVETEIITMSSSNGRTSDALRGWFPKIGKITHLNLPHLSWDSRIPLDTFSVSPDPRLMAKERHLKEYDHAAAYRIFEKSILESSPDILVAPCGIYHPMHVVTSHLCEEFVRLRRIPVIWYKEWPYGATGLGERIWGRFAQERKKSENESPTEERRSPSPCKSNILISAYPTETSILSEKWWENTCDEYLESYLGSMPAQINSLTPKVNFKSKTVMERKKNRRELRFFSISRSGHHAVIHWILPSFSGETLFVNDITSLKRKEFIFMNPSLGKIRECFAFNVENSDLSRLGKTLTIARSVIDAGPSLDIKNILILRNPYNLAASIANYGLADLCHVDAALDLWKAYALEYLERTSFLGFNCLRILFDRWFADESYRKSIAEKLGFSPHNYALGMVSREGGGSSFDGMAVDDARELKVLDRWKILLGKREYIELFDKHPEIDGLSCAIFGDVAKDQIDFLKSSI